MKNLVKDIEQNCEECKSDIEKTIQYLWNHGDISATSEYYREIWFFYVECLKMFRKEKNKKMKARNLTIDHFGISFETFKKIRARVGNLKNK